MLHRTSCGCEREIGMSKAHRPQYCEHGALFQYVHGLERTEKGTALRKPRKPRKPMKRTQPRRDWSDARRKVEEEQVCRACGSNTDVQAAHIIGRSSDQPKPGYASPALWVNPDSIIPLCGDFSPLKCHSAFDAHALDVLEFLTPAEQVQAVRDAGGIESARRKTAPSLYKILPPQTNREVVA